MLATTLGRQGSTRPDPTHLNMLQLTTREDSSGEGKFNLCERHRGVATMNVADRSGSPGLRTPGRLPAPHTEPRGRSGRHVPPKIAETTNIHRICFRRDAQVHQAPAV